MIISIWDLVLLPLSYVYIFTMIGIATKLKRSGSITGQTARKYVHIGVGMIVILIPILFSSKIIPTLIGMSFIVITYVSSPVSPFPRLKISAFKEGHGLGTVFYSISLTILLFFYFDEGWIIQIGFLPLVVGDATASLIGIQYGKHKWKFIPDKSIEGSVAGFFATLLVLFPVLLFYKLIGEISFTLTVIFYLVVIAALGMMIIELISPAGLDNVTIPLVCASIAVFFF